MFDALAH